MIQAKKASYELYPLLTQRIVNGERGLITGRAAKSMTERALLQHFAKRNPGFANDHGFYIMAEEMYLKAKDIQVIFPDTAIVLDNLLRAKFSISSHEGFDLPFGSFILAMPRGYTYQERRLPSLMVTWIPGPSYASSILLPFIQELEIPETKVRFSGLPNMGLMSIVYLDPSIPNARSRSVIYGEDLPHLLRANTPQQYHEAMVRLQILKDSDAMDEEEAALQFYSMRLVASMGVYHLATQGKYLHAGFPTPKPPKMEGKRPEHSVAPMTLTSRLSDGAETQASSSGGYRTWHIRQLRDERYYRGEHEKLAPGSRYVFIPETFVNLDATPHTQVG